VIILVDDDEQDAWDALDEMEGSVGPKKKSDKAKGKQKEEAKKHWIPDDMDPVLEELPKWTLLARVLQEIEEEIMRQDSLGTFRPARKWLFCSRLFEL
jgi:DNA excision repair protein ERCC-4